VVPTVLIFEKGKVKKRLDGTSDAGLNERQLKNTVSEHQSAMFREERMEATQAPVRV
jgi:hypothetical protein